MIVLGIDPGSTRIGYGAVQKERGMLSCVESGLLPIRARDKTQRLVELEGSLRAVLARIQPARVGVEKIYFSKNRKTALEVAQARGVILSVIGQAGIPIIELAPNEVKLAVTGDGNATKKGVALMVERFLRLPQEKRLDDVTDALAIAITVSYGALYEVGVRG